MAQDYAALGLKAGLEVHQQLNTGKLFCRCASRLREDSADIKFSRRLNVVASEMGEYDRAAVEAAGRNSSHIYEAYSDTTCLVEADEEPPAHADSDALKTVLEIALLAGSEIFPSIFTMRKLIVDGSTTSSFQRTMLVACGGGIKVGNKTIGIESIALEEDAAKIISRDSGTATYRLDRLGIPLIELATAPQLHSPEEVKAAALAIGSLFRSTGRAKRGLGSIRQDVNISISNGARVEIKGVQDLALMEEYVRREVQRQQALLELRDELKTRGISRNDFASKHSDITKIFTPTKCGFIKGAIARKDSVIGVRLKGMAGILGKELVPDYRFGTEAAGRAKAASGLGGIVHSDELPGNGISAEEKAAVAKSLSCGADDAFAFACGPRGKCERAVSAVLERCAEALEGVPAETRNALANGNTEYLRPLAGSARMYPETDLAPISIDEKGLAELKKTLPWDAEKRKKYYVETLHLNERLAEKMKLSNYARMFMRLVKAGHDAKQTAVLMLEGMPRLRREGIDIDSISEEMFSELLSAVKKGVVGKDVVFDVLRAWGKQNEKPLAEIISGMGYGKPAAGHDDARAVVARVVEQNAALVKEKGMHAIGALMGDVMKELRGRISGEEASKLLKEEILKRQ